MMIKEINRRRDIWKVKRFLYRNNYFLSLNVLFFVFNPFEDQNSNKLFVINIDIDVFKFKNKIFIFNIYIPFLNVISKIK